LSRHHWPGNIRELRNVIERSLLLNLSPSQCIAGRTSNNPIQPSPINSLLLEDISKHHILRVLKMETGNKSAAARQLGVSRKTLERKLSSWKIDSG
jgi:transcriptional regulator with PAS, ATPase and Fis domain